MCRIALPKLLVTQNGLRNHRQVGKMIRFVTAGGHFTRDARLAQSLLTDSERGTPPPIHIALMEDGQMVLHDGHHRAVALFIAGRDYVDPNEYEMVEYKYSDYAEPHPEKGWFTPFDIRTEVRKADFGRFKSNAKYLYEQCDISILLKYVRTYRNSYVEPRKISTVEELVKTYIEERGQDAQGMRNCCTRHRQEDGSTEAVDGPAPVDPKAGAFHGCPQDVPAPR